jgi:hypothetical protein
MCNTIMKQIVLFIETEHEPRDRELEAYRAIAVASKGASVRIYVCASCHMPSALTYKTDATCRKCGEVLACSRAACIAVPARGLKCDGCQHTYCDAFCSNCLKITSCCGSRRCADCVYSCRLCSTKLCYNHVVPASGILRCAECALKIN